MEARIVATPLANSGTHLVLASDRFLSLPIQKYHLAPLVALFPPLVLVKSQLVHDRVAFMDYVSDHEWMIAPPLYTPQEARSHIRENGRLLSMPHCWEPR